MTQQTETPDTIITLTLPTPEGGGISLEGATATLLIQRRDRGAECIERLGSLVIKTLIPIQQCLCIHGRLL